MKKTFCMCLAIFLVIATCAFSCLSSFAGEIGLINEDSYCIENQPKTDEQPQLTNWDLDGVESIVENCSIRDTYKGGKIYDTDWALVYIPNKIDENTTFGFLFPGNNYGYTAPDTLINMIYKYTKPNSVFIYSKESQLASLDKEDGVKYQCGEILKSLSKDLGVLPKRVCVIGYSNGGYTALHAAAALIKDHNLYVPSVIILDMGMGWGKGEFFISEEDAKPMLDAGTVVYHFTRHGETGHTWGSIQFASYGIPLYEVACLHGDHADIIRYAFDSMTIYRAVGEDIWYNTVEYGEPELVNEDAVNSHKPVEEEIADTEDIATDGAVA